MATAAEIRAELARRKAAAEGEVDLVAPPSDDAWQQRVRTLFNEGSQGPTAPINVDGVPLEQVIAQTPVSERDPVAVASAQQAREQLAMRDPEMRARMIAELRGELERRQDIKRKEKEMGKSDAELAAMNREERIAEYSEAGFGERTALGILGVGEMGLMMATGAGAQVVAGLAGLLGGGTADERANRINALSDALTFEPRTVPGQLYLEGIAKPLMALDDGARYVGDKLGGDNPMAEAAIYSTLVGGAELLGLRGAKQLKVDARLDNVRKTAAEMGIKLDQGGMRDDVIDAARRMSPEVRAQHAGDLRDAVVEARRQSKAVVQEQVNALRKTEATMRSSDVTAFAKALDEQMRLDGFDLDSVPAARAAINDLARIDKVSPLTGKRQAIKDAEVGQAELVEAAAARADGPQIELPDNVRREMARDASAAEMPDLVKEAAANTAASLNEIQTIRNRIERARSTMVSKGAESFSDPAIMMRTLERSLDEFLDNQFMNDMIDGSDAALSGWRWATEARIAHNRRFHEDRVIKQLLDRDASPEQIRAFVFGQSAVSPKPHASQVVGKLKELLGEDHPAIAGMRQDFIFELTSPLLQTKPNFLEFIRRFDKATHNHPTLIRELGIKHTKMKELRNFAEVAMGLPSKGRMITLDFITNFVSRFTVGHAIAKQGMKVSVFAKILQAIFGKDSVTQRKIMMEALEVMTGEPFVKRRSATAGTIIQNAVLSDITDAQKEVQRKEADKKRRKIARGE